MVILNTLAMHLSICSLFVNHINSYAYIKQMIFSDLFPFSFEQTLILRKDRKARQNTLRVSVSLIITAWTKSVLRVQETQYAKRARKLAEMVSTLHKESCNRAVIIPLIITTISFFIIKGWIGNKIIFWPVWGWSFCP